MGLLTADVTPIGVVLTGDSQPVELRESSYTVVPVAGQRRRPCLVAHAGPGFSVALGFVGTEWVGGAGTHSWLERFSAANRALGLDDFCGALSEALTDEWTRHSHDTCLWVFISGASEGRPVFRAVRNCGPDMDERLLYTEIGPSFCWHDDLANHIEMYGQPGESDIQTLWHHMANYRNGVLLPAVEITDRFQRLLEALFTGGSDGFAAVGTLDAYASIVKMRAEFVKRLFDSEKGICTAEERPIDGAVYVWSVGLDGEIRNHTGKKPEQVVSV